MKSASLENVCGQVLPGRNLIDLFVNIFLNVWMVALLIKIVVLLLLIIVAPTIADAGTCVLGNSPVGQFENWVNYYETDFNNGPPHDGYPIPGNILDIKCSNYTSAINCSNASQFSGEIKYLLGGWGAYSADLVRCVWNCSDNDGDGYSAEGGICGPVDCNDSDPAIYPYASDICDNKDNDCDGTRDEDAIFSTLYRDVDGDNYGTANSQVSSCSMVTGYVANGGDCNDTPGGGFIIHPGAAENCTDHVDNNCNGLADALDDACQFIPAVSSPPVVKWALCPTVSN
jgi:hypothetical protein